jgi:hypothetical protein
MTLESAHAIGRQGCAAARSGQVPVAGRGTNGESHGGTGTIVVERWNGAAWEPSRFRRNAETAAARTASWKTCDGPPDCRARRPDPADPQWNTHTDGPDVIRPGSIGENNTKGPFAQLQARADRTLPALAGLCSAGC